MKIDPAPEVSKVMVVEVESPVAPEKLKALVAPRAESTAMVKPALAAGEGSGEVDLVITVSVTEVEGGTRLVLACPKLKVSLPAPPTILERGKTVGHTTS